MRRIGVIAVLVLGVVAVGWRIWTRPPALVLSLRALPEVRSVEYTGPADAPLVVVHFLDWHFVPPEMCKLDGIDFESNLDTVERVQEDQLAIARYLIREHGLRDVYAENLTEKTLPDLHVRLDFLKTTRAKSGRCSRSTTTRHTMRLRRSPGRWECASTRTSWTPGVGRFNRRECTTLLPSGRSALGVGRLLAGVGRLDAGEPGGGPGLIAARHVRRRGRGGG